MPQPSKPEVLDYETLDPDAYRARYLHVPRERYLERHWRPRVEAAIHRHLGGRLLDLGCGFGNYLPSLAQVGRPVGVDLGMRWLRWARENGRGDLLVRADALHLPFADASFDGVLSIGLMEYVAPEVLLAEMARVLRPSSPAVILAPNRRGAFRATARGLHHLLGKPYACSEPSRAEMMAFFAPRFRVIESKLDDGMVWLPNALDRWVGAGVYRGVEALFRPLGENPWSNLMLFVVERAS